MASVLDRLNERIKAETEEVARIQSDAVKNIEAAHGRLMVLTQARDLLVKQPELETLLAHLGLLGIKLEA